MEINLSELHSLLEDIPHKRARLLLANWKTDAEDLRAFLRTIERSKMNEAAIKTMVNTGATRVQPNGPPMTSRQVCKFLGIGRGMLVDLKGAGILHPIAGGAGNKDLYDPVEVHNFKVSPDKERTNLKLAEYRKKKAADIDLLSHRADRTVHGASTAVPEGSPRSS